MLTIKMLLMLLAIVLFFLAAIGVQAPRNGNLIAGGLCLWAIAVAIT